MKFYIVRMFFENESTDQPDLQVFDNQEDMGDFVSSILNVPSIDKIEVFETSTIHKTIELKNFKQVDNENIKYIS